LIDVWGFLSKNLRRVCESDFLGLGHKWVGEITEDSVVLKCRRCGIEPQEKSKGESREKLEHPDRLDYGIATDEADHHSQGNQNANTKPK